MEIKPLQMMWTPTYHRLKTSLRGTTVIRIWYRDSK